MLHRVQWIVHYFQYICHQWWIVYPFYLIMLKHSCFCVQPRSLCMHSFWLSKKWTRETSWMEYAIGVTSIFALGISCRMELEHFQSNKSCYDWIVELYVFSGLPMIYDSHVKPNTFSQNRDSVRTITWYCKTSLWYQGNAKNHTDKVGTNETEEVEFHFLRNFMCVIIASVSFILDYSCIIPWVYPK